MFSHTFRLGLLSRALCLLLSFLIALQPVLLHAEANHLYGDAQQVITGKEAHTALVVTLGAGAVTGGRAAYQFTVNSSKAASLSAAERATLTSLEKKKGLS